MKKLATFVFALLLTASLSFAQTGGTAGAAAGTQEPAKTDTGKKGHKGGKKGHKGGKKSKKSSETTTTPPPK
jgi:Spy/CpxP family protein refolding chaperone